MAQAKASGVHADAGAAADVQNASGAEFLPYRVVSIEKSDMGEQAKGAWYEYVVDNGKSAIKGHKPGTKREVREHAERFVAELNARRGGRGGSVWSPRRGK